jgi:hypothetical protein
MKRETNTTIQYLFRAKNDVISALLAFEAAHRTPEARQ